MRSRMLVLIMLLGLVVTVIGESFAAEYGERLVTFELNSVIRVTFTEATESGISSRTYTKDNGIWARDGAPVQGIPEFLSDLNSLVTESPAIDSGDNRYSFQGFEAWKMCWEPCSIDEFVTCCINMEAYSLADGDFGFLPQIGAWRVFLMFEDGTDASIDLGGFIWVHYGFFAPNYVFTRVGGGLVHMVFEWDIAALLARKAAIQ